MKYTNKLNLPEVFVNFYKSDKTHEFDENRYSVTEILDSVKSIILNRKHREEIEVDICDTIPALFGSAVHEVLEKNAPTDVRTEVKMEYKFGSKTLVGRCDVLNIKDLVIEDYKTCSASKVIKQDFNDYYLQGMMYAFMEYLIEDIKIKKLKFYMLMKDWSKLKSINMSSYPKSPIFVWEYNISDSDYIYIDNYIHKKFKEIDEGIKDCSDEEKWYTGDKYAVYKNIGDKRASKVFDTREEAEKYMDENKCSYMDVRKGENLKCNYYCNVKKWCNS